MRFGKASLALALGVSLGLGGFAAAQEATLFDAVKAGDVAAVQALLAAKADPNLVLQDTSTVLSWAVVQQNPELVRVLLAAGANPNANDQDGMTPFLFACQGSDSSIVAQLLDAKADVRAKRPDGLSALSLCARYATAAIVERMVAAGADVKAADLNGQTPLMWAAAGGQLATIDYLIAHGAEVNAASAKGFTPLFFAIKTGVAKAPEHLIEAGANLNHVAGDGTTAIMLALYGKKFALAGALAERGAELNHWDQNGNQPLHVAAIENQPALIRTLIAKGADANALTQPSKLNWQTEPNAGCNPPPRIALVTPLLVAAQNGSAEAMKAIVEGGGKPDFKAVDGTNVVLAAAVGGSVEALDYATSLQPNLKVSDDNGRTPMHLVIFNRRIQVSGHVPEDTPAMITLLADRGAELEARNGRGQTPADIIRRAETDVQKAYEAALVKHGKPLTQIAAERRRQQGAQ